MPFWVLVIGAIIGLFTIGPVATAAVGVIGWMIIKAADWWFYDKY